MMSRTETSPPSAELVDMDQQIGGILVNAKGGRL